MGGDENLKKNFLWPNNKSVSHILQLECTKVSRPGYADTPQPLYNTIVGVQANFRVSYPIRVITKVKYGHIAKIV